MASGGGADSSTSAGGPSAAGARSGRPGRRKRPRSQSSASLDDQTTRLQEEDFTCPICFNLYEEVYSTVCGHSFCYRCVRQMLMQSPHCPICKAGLPPQNPIHPNFSLNDLVTKYKLQKVGSAKRRCFTNEGQRLFDAVTAATDEDLPKALEMIQERLRKKEERSAGVNHHILMDFFLESQKRKEKELADVKKQLEVIKQDIADLKSRDEGLPFDEEEATRRKVRVHGNFEELLADYVSRRVPCIQVNNSSEGEDHAEGEGGGERPYEEFAETLEQFTRFSGWREISSLNYGDQSNACSIVSSIEFDRDGELFAVGGVTKKIKIYSFANLLETSTRFHTHFPICQMTCQAKLSSVFFNPYHKNHLASSDYEGCVCIWDVNTGTKMINHQEHSKRVWSVVYNPAEPTMYASGSDDCTVKLWCTSRPHSIFKIDAKANVCSVRFHPVERHYLAYGSADHAIHYIDLRNPGQQLFELKGHRKAVSYVHFISTSEVISASTDGDLKLWNVKEGQVLRTYRGHINEKNFVGLTVSNDFISCGSEDNSVYVYSKQVSKPMLKYKFNTPSNLLMSGELESQLQAVSSAQGPPLPPPQHHTTHQTYPQAPQQQPTQQAQQSQDTAADFVSSVCWKKNSNLVLAANSQGHIKLLEMC